MLLWHVVVQPNWDSSRSIGCYPTQSHYSDTGPTSPNTIPIMSTPGDEKAVSTIFKVFGMTRPSQRVSFFIFEKLLP